MTLETHFTVYKMKYTVSMLLLTCWVFMLGTHKLHVSQVKPIFSFSLILSWVTERLLKTTGYALDWITNSLVPSSTLTVLWRCPATSPYYQNTVHSLSTPGLETGTLHLSAHSPIDWASANISHCIISVADQNKSTASSWLFCWVIFLCTNFAYQ